MFEGSLPTVLVVDDCPAITGVVSYNVKLAGCSARVASNGRDAWEMAKRHVFDLVVTDEEMPVMSGQELCLWLRSDERYAKTPIILLTARALEIDATLIKNELGVSCIIGKPFSPMSLVNTIRNELSATAQHS